MDNDLNHFFFTIKIFNNDQEVHSFITPTSGLLESLYKFASLSDQYIIKIFDHENKLRVDFRCFEKVSGSLTNYISEVL